MASENGRQRQPARRPAPPAEDPAPNANGGRKDPRNSLNDLTGREWLYFLNSVESTAYPVNGPESYGHRLRRRHPSPKPPQLMRRLIEFFTKAEEWVLDPFVGVGGTLLGCSLAGRHGVGVDLSPDYLEIYRRVCKAEGLAEQIGRCGDARHLDTFPEVAGRTFDLILTDPPYTEMLSRRQEGEKKKRTGRSDPTPFTTLPEDLGNLTYDEFLDALADVVNRALPLLRNGRYLVLFAKDLQPDERHHNLLHADIVNRLTKLPSLRFRGYKIWHDRTVNLYPFGYPYTFVANQLHQYILVFRKESR